MLDAKSDFSYVKLGGFKIEFRFSGFKQFYYLVIFISPYFLKVILMGA